MSVMLSGPMKRILLYHVCVLSVCVRVSGAVGMFWPNDDW